MEGSRLLRRLQSVRFRVSEGDARGLIGSQASGKCENALRRRSGRGGGGVQLGQRRSRARNGLFLPLAFLRSGRRDGEEGGRFGETFFRNPEHIEQLVQVLEASDGLSVCDNEFRAVGAESGYACQLSGARGVQI